MFIEELLNCVSVVYNMRVLKHFASRGIETFESDFVLYQVFIYNVYAKLI